MTRVVRNAAILCAGGILMASAALANVPSAATSSVSNVGSGTTAGKAFISVEGQSAGAPDNCSDGRCANYLVTVRDALSNPIAGSTVVFDGSGCSDIQFSCDQSVGGSTGQTYLSGKKVSGTTNAAGQFTFRLQGASNAVLQGTTTTSAGTNVNTACATIYADGVVLGPNPSTPPNVVVSVYDVNGSGSPGGAVSGADAALVAGEAVKVGLGAQARARDDINFSGTVTGADAAVYAAMAVQAGLGTGTKQTAPFCP